jgi:hypothetical protein
MRPKNAYIFATTICALALILACPSYARAKSGDWRRPGETQKSNASHARAGAKSPISNPDTLPEKDYGLPPIAVLCSGSADRWIPLKPGQFPWEACPKGRPRQIDFGVLTTGWVVPGIAGIRPPSTQQDDGGGH